MPKVVLNSNYGDGILRLSDTAISLLASKKNITIKEAKDFILSAPRWDPDLVDTIEELGTSDSSEYPAVIMVAEVPSGEKFIISSPGGGEYLILEKEIEWATL